MRFMLAIGLFVYSSMVSATSLHHYALANGLRIVVKEDHRAPLVVSSIWYKVGGAYELPGKTGISHILEHMMFKGTKAHPAGEFSRLITETGGEENAFTDADYTAYFQEIAASKLGLAFSLEADRMQNLTLPEAEFAKELNVIKEERFMRFDDNPEALTYERLLAAAFLNNPYRHTAMGWLSDISQTTTADLRQWYQTYYAPNNAILVVIGDVDPNAVFTLARTYFGAIPARKIPVMKKLLEPEALGARSLIVKAPAKLPVVLLGYNVPSLNSTSVSWEPYALLLLAATLDNDSSSRLTAHLVRGKQWLSKANVDYSPFSLFSTLFMMSATPTAQHTTAEAKTALLEEIKALQTTPISDEELARVKIQLKAQQIYDKDPLLNQTIFLGQLVSVGLPADLSTQYIQEIDKIVPAQIQQVAKKYLTIDRLTLAELQPLPITKAETMRQQNNLSEVNHVR